MSAHSSYNVGSLGHVWGQMGGQVGGCCCLSRWDRRPSAGHTAQPSQSWPLWLEETGLPAHWDQGLGWSQRGDLTFRAPVEAAQHVVDGGMEELSLRRTQGRCWASQRSTRGSESWKVFKAERRGGA